MQKFSAKQVAVIITAMVPLLVAQNVWGLDLPLAHWSGGAGVFPLRDNTFLTTGVHDGARRLVWVLALGLCIAVWWPPGVLRRVTIHRRLRLASTTLVGALAISALTSFSTASCTWSLSYFGCVAYYTPYLEHVFAVDGGGCFPASHASSGFAFVGGYFAFRETATVVARRWLAAALLAGAVLGSAQQIRGPHFTSHTLWRAFNCWCVPWAIDGLFARVALNPLYAYIDKIA